MGKSHLMKRVFPELAHNDFQARCVILDVRNQNYSIPDFLHMACGQLGNQTCKNYYSAHQTLINRPKVEVKNCPIWFSRLNIAAKNNIDDAHQRDLYLTTQFVNDLNDLQDRPMLLVFDSVNNADVSIQEWLMEMLLTLLSPLNHVRVVVAGRSLPEAYGSYTSLCQSYQLLPITNVADYIAYCKDINALLPEEAIGILASASLYTPGFFIELVHNIELANNPSVVGVTND